MKLNQKEQEFLAVVFAAGEPVETERLAKTLELSGEEVIGLAAAVGGKLETEGFPFEVRKLENQFQLCSRAEFAPVIRTALELRKNTPLSAAAMETLAVIAYHQPVTKNYIDKVRGVDCYNVVNTLIDRALVEEAGRLELPGRPLTYRTTAHFLRCFQLESLEDLPKLQQLAPNAGKEGSEKE